MTRIPISKKPSSRGRRRSLSSSPKSILSISPARHPIVKALNEGSVLPPNLRDLHDKISFYAMEYDEKEHHPVELVIRGDVEYLYLLHEQGKLQPFQHVLVNNAITFGRLDVATWLYGLGYKATSSAVDNAAANGDLEAIRWLEQQRVKGTERAVVNAAMKNRMEVLKWLLSKGYPVDGSLVDVVARKGHLNMLVYLDSLGVRGSAQAVESAAFEGHTHILRWLLENGYPVTEYTMSFAENSGNPYTVFYLQSLQE